MEKRNYTKRELKNLFSNLGGKRTTDDMVAIMIDALWRSKPSSRTSGFYWAGAPDAVLTWTNATRTVLLQPTPVEGADYTPFFRFYTWSGRPVLHRREPFDAEVTTLPNPDAVQLPAEEGLYMVYYDVNEERRRYELTYTKNPDINDLFTVYTEKVIVAFVYWDATAGEASYFGDSRHGSEWNPQIHWMWHQTLNSRRQTGLKITDAVFDGDGDANEDFQFGISGGELWHEDIYAEVDAVTSIQSLPVWYFDAAGNPRFTSSAGKKFLNTGTGRVAYNPAGGNLEEITDGQFALFHLFATNCTIHPVISVMGTDDFPGIGEAVSVIEAEVATLRQNMPHANLMHIGSVIIQTSDDYTNAAKARVVWASSDIDTFTTELEFDENTRILTLRQNNEKPDIEVELPEESKIVTQENHGFTEKQAIRNDGTEWVLALADSEENSNVGGIVVEIIDADNFRYKSGSFYYNPDWVAGYEYFLSPTTPGLITTLSNPEVWEVGQVRQHLGWGVDGALKIEIDVGQIITEEEVSDYTHPEKTWVNKTPLTGGYVVSNLTIDGLGHPTDWVTRLMTYSDVGAEQAFTKNTGFNLNLGTTAGTVAEGNHTHNYVPLGGLDGQLWKSNGAGSGSWFTPEAGSGGGVSEVIAGNGMSFTTITTTGSVTLGTPSSLTVSSTNSVTSSSHTHALDLSGRSILTQHSLTGGGTLASDRTLYLVGDVASPGILKYYGTNATGTRGFYDLPSGGVVSVNWGDVGGTLANQTDLQSALDGKEPTFTKNDAFNLNFGTTAGTVAQGNDSRIINGQTAYGWGDHAGLYDKYTSWNLKTNGVQRLGITSGGSVNIVQGANISVAYSAGGVVTISGSNTVYSGSTSVYLSGSSFQREALTGDVTATRNSNITVISEAAVTAAKLNNNVISGLDLLSGSPASSDQLMISDSGIIKKINVSDVVPWADAGTYLYPRNGERVQIGYSGTNNYGNLYVNGDIATGVSKFLGFNSYYSSGFKHIGTGHATFMKQESTDFTFYVSTVSRSANSTITYNTVKINNASGEVYAKDFINSTSSREVKKGIQPIIDLQRFDLIPIRQFIYKNDPEEKIKYGGISEEIEQYAPELIYRGYNDIKTYAPISLLFGKTARLEQRVKELELEVKELKENNQWQ